MTTLRNLPKSASFTRWLTPDSRVPSIEEAKKVPEETVRRARPVDGSFTWMRPEKRKEVQLAAVSEPAMRDLGLDPEESKTQEFLNVFSGQEVIEDEQKGIYPWSQAYAGWQFGEWAGQLGDGRVVSLFESTNQKTGKRYELQLKGAGLTPYSRFADGKAVLRSSIREALVSEHLNALGIPTTRALSLVQLPGTFARRYTMEECAIVCRMAESWIRIGTFDFHRARGARDEMRKLADYCISEVFQLDATAKDRYQQLYREIVTRNATTLGYWQAYGFMNGVLNTDNTSILGLSMDFGPFSFMDTFDAAYTPNHDDGLLRYSFKNQPSAVWWNMLRLGEDLGELLGAGDLVDDETFKKDGLKQDQVQGVIKRAEEFIESQHDVFKEAFMMQYTKLMRARLGLKEERDSDNDDIFTPLLDTLQDCELDYNVFFRNLSNVDLSKTDFAELIDADRGFAPSKTTEEAAEAVTKWIQETYKPRLESEGTSEEDRRKLMNSVNPKFLLRTWLLDEVIKEATSKGSFDLYNTVQNMALNPFQDSWGGDADLEKRYTSPPAKAQKGIQCSCSS
uniref:Selenoprotein O n=1 Tax=Blastobotrys adeninivorans TaxID=409370 RepID=A0A060T6N1_BLAAD